MVVQTAPADDDRARSARRQRVLLGGKLVFHQGERSLDCLIRDLSPTGARVRLRADAMVGGYNDVWLINIQGAAAYRIKVVWRKGAELGVEFTETHDLSGPTPPAIAHLRRLWLDCAQR